MRSLRQAHEFGLEGVSSRVNLMDMRALRAPVMKFSVDGFGRLFAGDFDALHTPVASVGSRQDSGNVGDGVEGLAVSDLHSSSPAGGRERSRGRRVQQAGAWLCLPVLLVRHPQI